MTSPRRPRSRRSALLSAAALAAGPAAAFGQGAAGPVWTPAPVAAPVVEPLVRRTGFAPPAAPFAPPAAYPSNVGPAGPAGSWGGAWGAPPPIAAVPPPAPTFPPGSPSAAPDPFAAPDGFAGPPAGRGWAAPPVDVDYGDAAVDPFADPFDRPVGDPFAAPISDPVPLPSAVPPPLIAPPAPLACDGPQAGRLYGAAVGPARALLERSLAVRLDTPTSAALLDFQNRQTDKQLLLLGSLPTVVPTPVLVPGAQMRLSGLWGRTNTRGKFGYLGRFPPDFNGNTAGDLRILQANLAATAYFTPYAAGYVETLFSDVFTFPTFNQGSFQVRQAYATFGDVRRFPMYAFIGKKTVSYGDFGTLSPFTQAVPWHYFAALGEGAGVGFVRGGFHAVLTGLSGGRGIRTVDSPSEGRVNNFAVNTHYAGRAGRFEYLVGAGYLDGTIYDADTPEHIDPTISGPRNGVWDVNGVFRFGRYIAAAEVARTLHPWPVTNRHVTAYKAEGAVDVAALGRPLRLSTSWSEGIQGDAGTEFERNAQLVLGAGWQVAPNALLSLEYVRSIGFAPLIGLTAPRVSDRDVRQNSLVLGVSLVL